MPAFLVSLLVTIALDIIAYAIMPKPKQPKQAVQDLQAPTAEAGRPIAVVFGSKTIKGGNVLWYGDANTNTYKYSGGGKGGK